MNRVIRDIPGPRTAHLCLYHDAMDAGEIIVGYGYVCGLKDIRAGIVSASLEEFESLFLCLDRVIADGEVVDVYVDPNRSAVATIILFALPVLIPTDV